MPLALRHVPHRLSSCRLFNACMAQGEGQVAWWYLDNSRVSLERRSRPGRPGACWVQASRQSRCPSVPGAMLGLHVGSADHAPEVASRAARSCQEGRRAARVGTLFGAPVSWHARPFRAGGPYRGMPARPGVASGRGLSGLAYCRRGHDGWHNLNRRRGGCAWCPEETCQ